MAFNKKTWTDRVAEFINRRSITHEDGSEELVTVARSEGTVSQEGDAFNAATMNDLEERIEDEFESINSNLANRRKLLWKNPNPTSAFSGQQTIMLNSTDYDWLEFHIAQDTTTGRAYVEKIKKGESLFAGRVMTSTSNYLYGLQRVFTHVRDFNNYGVSDGQLQQSGSNRTVNNNYLVPIAIYGIKD